MKLIINDLYLIVKYIFIKRVFLYTRNFYPMQFHTIADAIIPTKSAINAAVKTNLIFFTPMQLV